MSTLNSQILTRRFPPRKSSYPQILTEYPAIILLLATLGLTLVLHGTPFYTLSNLSLIFNSTGLLLTGLTTTCLMLHLGRFDFSFLPLMAITSHLFTLLASPNSLNLTQNYEILGLAALLSLIVPGTGWLIGYYFGDRKYNIISNNLVSIGVFIPIYLLILEALPTPRFSPKFSSMLMIYPAISSIVITSILLATGLVLWRAKILPKFKQYLPTSILLISLSTISWLLGTAHLSFFLGAIFFISITNLNYLSQFGKKTQILAHSEQLAYEIGMKSAPIYGLAYAASGLAAAITGIGYSSLQSSPISMTQALNLTMTLILAALLGKNQIKGAQPKYVHASIALISLVFFDNAVTFSELPNGILLLLKGLAISFLMILEVRRRGYCGKDSY